MKALAAIIRSGFKNIPDAVLFCHPDRSEDLNPWTTGKLVDWVEVELPDSAEFVNLGSEEDPYLVLADFDENDNASEPEGYVTRGGVLCVDCIGADHKQRWEVKTKLQ